MIQQLLDTTPNDTDLLNALGQLEAENLGLLEETAPIWGPALVQRNPTTFLTYLNYYIHDKALIETLLPKIDPFKHPEAYAVLYERVADIARFNRDVLALAESSLTDDPIMAMFKAYGVITQYWSNKSFTVLYDDTAAALFKRNPKAYEQLINYFLHKDHLPYPKLKALAYRHRKTNTVYWNLFRQTATKEEWHAELARILKMRPDRNVYDELVKVHPQVNFEMEELMYEKLKKKFGQHIIPYLQYYSRRYTREVVTTLLANEKDDQKVLNQLNQYGYRLGFKEMAEVWLPVIYERNPLLFEKFIKYHLPNNQPALLEAMLPRVKANGQLDLYQAMYSVVVKQAKWNQQVRALLASNLTTGSLLYELDWLDVPNVYLEDDTAAQIYQRHPKLLGHFLERHLQLGRTYRQLKAAVAGEEAWWDIFRRTASPSAWEAEMETLLGQDIPAEQIAAELEKRHPRHGRPPTAVVRKFLEKYGEAVLPYLEKHVQLLTRPRLRRLLALGIERGDLRRELELLARHQPSDFANMVDIWLPVLYDSNSDFFDNFMLRHLTWQIQRENQVVLRQMLNRMEADGKHRMFTQVYRLCVDEASWMGEMQILMRSTKSDQEVLEALQRRQTWFTLPDSVAVALYRRNPDLFREYVMNAVGRNYYVPQGYEQLRQAAQEHGDEALLQHLTQRTISVQEWEKEINAMIANAALSGAEVAQRLIDIQPQYSYQLQEKGGLVVTLFERYGAPLVEYIIQNIGWILPYGDHQKKKREKLIKTLLKAAPPERYWELFFWVADNKVWNEKLRDILNLPTDEFFDALEERSPRDDGNRYSQWAFEADVMAKVHAHDPQRAYPYLKRYATTFSDTLFQQAEKVEDDLLLDYMTYHALIMPKQSTNIPEMAVERLRRLYADSPEKYVHHAAQVFNQVQAFQFYGVQHVVNNPVFQVVAHEHHDAWLNSPSGMRDLLESPNIFIQLMGWDMLMKGGAAARVIENLFLARVFLLSRAKPNSKKKVVQCLEQAAQQRPDEAEKIMATLEGVMDYQGKRAVRDRVIAAYARIRAGVG